MDSVEVPQYFICPISLQIMEDPVTAITGITYDRRSIERWLFADNNTTCPVTNQPLPRGSDLTPNHTLRRLIQAWCTLNAEHGVRRIPTPRAPLDRSTAASLLRDLSSPTLHLPTLKILAALASDSESNRRCMLHAGASGSIIQLIVSFHKMNRTGPIQEALVLLQSLRVPSDDLKPLVADNDDLVNAITWALQLGSTDNNVDLRSTAVLALKSIFEVASSSLLARLRLAVFEAVSAVLRDRLPQQATKAALLVLLHACPVGRNRTRIVDAGAVHELVELELTAPDKRTTELVLGVLEHLCGCADGRAKLVGHAAGIAVVSKRILRVSPVADDRAVKILASLCRSSGTNEVLQEMLRVGAVSKFCLVLQANCSSKVREEARSVLRLHSKTWNNSPCIQLYMLSRTS